MRLRFRLRIRWLMIAVAIVALILRLPLEAHDWLLCAEVFGAIAAVWGVVIAVPAAFAPRGRRRTVVAWATAVHPLSIMLWVLLLWLVRFARPLQPGDHSPTLVVLYLALALSVAYLPVVALGRAVATYRWPRRGGWPQVAMLLLVWGLVGIFLRTDPLQVFGWLWDPF